MRISDWSSDVCSSDLLDKDIAGRIRFSRKGEKSGFLRDYSKMKIMDLSEVHAGGAGNAPILGQYLAKIILNKDTQRFSSPDRSEERRVGKAWSSTCISRCSTYHKNNNIT